MIFNYLKLALVILFLGYSTTFYAQINAPELTCVKNDSLFWTPSIINCSTHLGYNIYYAPSFNGPYSILTSINNPASSKYFHSQPGVFYYYLESIANCPGETILKSDTLTNKFLDKPKIKSTTVVNNSDVKISWHSIDHPNLSEYVIYKNTNIGTIEIGRTQDTMYTDLGVDLSTSQRYTLTISDQCNQQGLFSQTHNTISIHSINDSCTNHVLIERNDYDSWLVDGYKIEIVSINHEQSGNDEVILVENQLNNIILSNLRNDTDYCLYSRMINLITLDTSKSNEICFHTFLDQLEILYPYNISYDFNNNIDYNWVWSNEALIQNAELQNVNNTIISNINIATPLRYNNQINISSSIIFPIHLECTALCNSLSSWPLSPPEMSLSINKNNMVAIEYVEPILPEQSEINNTNLVYINERSQHIPITNLSHRSGIIETDANITLNDSICYYIEYQHINDTSLLNQHDLISKSPTRCIKKFPSLFFPNAFSPNGYNNLFKPQGKKLRDLNYQIKIYNRYGVEVYSSNNILEGWDGTKNGELQSSGLYLYKVQIGREDITSYSINGNVYLVK